MSLWVTQDNLTCFPTAEQPGAGPQPCLLPSPALLCPIILATLFCHRSLHVPYWFSEFSVLLQLQLSHFPFSLLLYTLLLLPFLLPCVVINCHSTRGCSFECFHVAKWYFSSLLSSLVFLKVFSTCSHHLVALNSDAFLSLSPIAKQQLNLPHSPLWELVVITETIFLDNTVSELVVFHDVFVDFVTRDLQSARKGCPTWTSLWRMWFEGPYAATIINAPKYCEARDRLIIGQFTYYAPLIKGLEILNFIWIFSY